MDKYIEGNKAAWEEAFDKRDESWGADITERISAEEYAFFNDETKVAFCFSASALSHDRNMLKVGSVPGSSAEWVRCELEVPAGPVRAAR